jgi:hypothetical protein
MNPPAPVPPQFSQTLATTAVAPNYTPTNTPSAIPQAYQGYLASQAGFQDNQVGANKTQALGNISDANAATAAKQKLQDINDRLLQIKDLQDPSKYQQVRTKDGGFSYFDPSGKQISIQQYSQATGKLPSDILKGSDNTLDHQYLNDYKQLEDFINAAQSGDSKTLDKHFKINSLDLNMTPSMMSLTISKAITLISTVIPMMSMEEPEDKLGQSEVLLRS